MKNKKNGINYNKLRLVKGDARIKEFEDRYNINFGVRSDMKASTFLKMRGYPSAARMLRGS